MFDLLYELVLYDLLGYTQNSYQVLSHQSIAVVVTTIFMLILVWGIFKIGLFLLTFPFRWLN